MSSRQLLEHALLLPRTLYLPLVPGIARSPAPQAGTPTLGVVYRNITETGCQSGCFSLSPFPVSALMDNGVWAVLVITVWVPGNEALPATEL